MAPLQKCLCLRDWGWETFWHPLEQVTNSPFWILLYEFNHSLKRHINVLYLSHDVWSSIASNAIQDDDWGTYWRHDGHQIIIHHVPKWHFCAFMLVDSDFRKISILNLGEWHWHRKWARVSYQSSRLNLWMFYSRFTFLLDNRSCYSDSSICCHLQRSQSTTMETLVS